MKRKPKPDESTERDEPGVDDFTDAFKMLLKDAPAPRSKNRRPANEEPNRRYRLKRRRQGSTASAARQDGRLADFATQFP